MKKYMKPQAAATDFEPESFLLSASSPSLGVYEEEADGESPLTRRKGFSSEDWDASEE